MKIQTYNNRHYFIGFTKSDLADLRGRKLNNITKIYIFMVPNEYEDTSISYSDPKTLIDPKSFLYLVSNARKGKYVINVYTMNLPREFFNRYTIHNILGDKWRAYDDVLKLHFEPLYEAYINYCNLIRIHRTREALQYDIFKPYYDYRHANLPPDESMVIQSFCFYR